MKTEEPTNSRQADFYYEHYVAWKEWGSLFSYSEREGRYFAAELSATLGRRSARVVEIGFGAGRLLAWLRDAGYNVRGAEIIPELLDAAAGSGFDVYDLRAGSTCELWQQPADAFLAFDVFEHLSVAEIKNMLVLMHGALCQGGRIVLRVPNGQSPFGLAFQADDMTHQTTLSAGSLAQIVADVNLTLAELGDTQLNLVEVRNQAHSIAPGVHGYAKRAALCASELLFSFISLPFRYERYRKLLYGANIVGVIEKSLKPDGRDR